MENVWEKREAKHVYEGEKEGTIWFSSEIIDISKGSREAET
jgi:hypothetical protein